MRADEQEPDTRRESPDESAIDDKSISIKGPSVDPAVVHRRHWDLPREVCMAVLKGTEGVARQPDRRAEVSRGHSTSEGGRPERKEWQVGGETL